jgi:broad specificity phosphatase PhoE
MLRRCAVVLVVWCLGCSAAPAGPGPAQVIIIRHAEKPAKGHDLSPKGRQRAAALVPYFLETPEVTEHKTPVAIYAQKSTEANRSRRPVETVKDLAKALKFDVIEFAHEDYAAMVKEINAKPEYAGKTVLVCWEHHGIPDVAKAFGVKDPPHWHDSAFDRTWVITFENGKAVLNDLPQRLMYGDSKK